MQFKPAGRRVQVLVYAGYDKEKRRAVVKMVGSFDRYNFTLSDGLENSLTDEQKKELQSHIESLRQSAKNEVRHYTCETLDRRIVEVADTISAGEYDCSPEYAERLREAMKRLNAALRKAGQPRPKRQPVHQVAAAPGQMTLEGDGGASA